jgi:hypothetical protein
LGFGVAGLARHTRSNLTLSTSPQAMRNHTVSAAVYGGRGTTWQGSRPAFRAAWRLFGELIFGSFVSESQGVFHRELILPFVLGVVDRIEELGVALGDAEVVR